MPKYDIDPMPAQISADVIALLEQTETATVGHWRHWGFCDRRIQPLLRRKRVAGPRSRWRSPGPDSTLLHHALGLLRPGDILVVDRLGDDRHACWGGGVTVAAKAAGAKAGVVDGPCTDLEEVEASDFPLWCRGIAPISACLRPGGRLNKPVSIVYGQCGTPRSACDAGEKMHRRAGVKMHHGHSQVSATATAAFQFDQRAAFPPRPGDCLRRRAA